MNATTSLKKIIKGFRYLSLEKRVTKKAILKLYNVFDFENLLKGVLRETSDSSIFCDVVCEELGNSRCGHCGSWVERLGVWAFGRLGVWVFGRLGVWAFGRFEHVAFFAFLSHANHFQFYYRYPVIGHLLGRILVAPVIGARRR